MANSSHDAVEKMENPSEMKSMNKSETTRAKASTRLHSMDSVSGSSRTIVKILVIYTGGTIGMVPTEGGRYKYKQDRITTVT